MTEFDVNKPDAQRKLKYFHTQKFLFTPEDLTKQGIHLKGLQRKNPQKYYLTEMKTMIINSRRNNVLKDTTGIGQKQIHPFSSPINQLKTLNLQQLLARLSSAILYIHKLQIWTSIDKKYYEDLKDAKPDSINKAKVYEERIGQAHGSPNVKFIVSPNGTVMIHIICSDNPFRLYVEQDVSDILVFLGRVKDRLHSIFSDTRDTIIPPVKRWILKGCDVNKDIAINAVAQITLPDIQIPLVEKAVRAYVKSIGDRAYYRFELSLTPNESVGIALERIRTEVKIDKEILSM